jgi:hypothetical protein
MSNADAIRAKTHQWLLANEMTADEEPRLYVRKLQLVAGKNEEEARKLEAGPPAQAAPKIEDEAVGEVPARAARPR